MAITEVIKFEGSPDALVWKYPEEDFNTMSQLVVDETHEALLVVNGNAADLFGPGARPLTVSNTPLARKFVEVPTGGVSPFPCKVFFINKVHHMDLLWGTDSPFTCSDPDYQIFIHVMSHGSLSVSVSDSRKFMLKMVGFRDTFDPQELVKKFRGIIVSHVKHCISQLMIKAKISFFDISAYIFEISGAVKTYLDKIFDEYGVKIEYFNIEEVAAPEEDYQKVGEAKERRAARIIDGTSWWKEHQMEVALAFASNEGTVGNMGGALGGFMMGGAMAGPITNIAKGVFEEEKGTTEIPPQDLKGINSPLGGGSGDVDINEFFRTANDIPHDTAAGKCAKCGAELPENAKFCLECGEKVVKEDANMVVCPGCGKSVPKGKFCLECGYRFSKNVCPMCGTELRDGAKFCPECGEKI